MTTHLEPKDKISFIFYHNRTFPKYFEVHRNHLKILILGMPIITLIAITLCLIFFIRYQSDRWGTLTAKKIQEPSELIIEEQPVTPQAESPRSTAISTTTTAESHAPSVPSTTLLPLPSPSAKLLTPD